MGAPERTGPSAMAEAIAKAITEAGGIDYDLYEPPSLNPAALHAIDAEIRPLVEALRAAEPLALAGARSIARDHPDDEERDGHMDGLDATLDLIRAALAMAEGGAQ